MLLTLFLGETKQAYAQLTTKDLIEIQKSQLSNAEEKLQLLKNEYNQLVSNGASQDSLDWKIEAIKNQEDLVQKIKKELNKEENRPYDALEAEMNRQIAREKAKQDWIDCLLNGGKPDITKETTETQVIIGEALKEALEQKDNRINELNQRIESTGNNLNEKLCSMTDIDINRYWQDSTGDSFFNSNRLVNQPIYDIKGMLNDINNILSKHKRPIIKKDDVDTLLRSAKDAAQELNKEIKEEQEKKDHLLEVRENLATICPRCIKR